MATLAVALRAPQHLHRERQLLPREPGEDAGFEHGAEVVGIGDERVLVPTFQQLLEHSRGDERGVEVAVAGRRPFELGVGGPGGGGEVVREDLRHAALDEVEREVRLQVGVALERLQRVVARAEAVHQDERKADAVALAQLQHLARDHVEERDSLLDLQQRLRRGHPHARAESAVEADRHGVPKRLPSFVARLRQVGRGRQVPSRLDLVLRNRAGLALRQPLVVVAEVLDRQLGRTIGAHLLQGLFQAVGHGRPAMLWDDGWTQVPCSHELR